MPFFLAAIIAFLKPRSLLELGCGRGDVLFLLSLLDQFRIQGIDLSRDILEKAWPPLAPNLACGELLEIFEAFHKKGLRFNTFCGFDIWEHLHPARLHDCISAMTALSEKDALFFLLSRPSERIRSLAKFSPWNWRKTVLIFRRESLLTISMPK